MEAEFDRFAEDYLEILARNTAISGGEPAFFHKYKIEIVRNIARQSNLATARIVDFGSGIGNSIPYFQEYFPESKLVCADTSPRSLEFAIRKHPGAAVPLLVTPPDPLDLPDDTVDLCFSACVFHHIDHVEHFFWLSELLRITRPGGAIVVFEHNPFNPLTRHAVNTCPLDVNACLVRPRALARNACSAGWVRPAIAYRLFFPGFVARLRPLEAYLTGLPLGAQYSLHAVKPPS